MKTISYLWWRFRNRKMSVDQLGAEYNYCNSVWLNANYANPIEAALGDAAAKWMSNFDRWAKKEGRYS